MALLVDFVILFLAILVLVHNYIWFLNLYGIMGFFVSVAFNFAAFYIFTMTVFVSKLCYLILLYKVMQCKPFFNIGRWRGLGFIRLLFLSSVLNPLQSYPCCKSISLLAFLNVLCFAPTFSGGCRSYSLPSFGRSVVYEVERTRSECSALRPGCCIRGIHLEV